MGPPSTDGSYVVTPLPPGDYYLVSRNLGLALGLPLYIDEWWTGDALDPSSPNCGDAKPIRLLHTDLIDTDFWLDIGGYISGTVMR